MLDTVNSPTEISRPTSRMHSGFAIVALLFFMTMGYGTVTTPLWPLFQDRDGFGTTMVTVVFSMYALGTVLSLLFAGNMSDRFGRTRVLGVAAALGIASILVFLLWDSVAGLLVARTVQGMGVGLTTSTATASMVELAYAGAVRRPRTTATTLTTLANLGGLGAGALIGGMISEWAPAPLSTPFIVFGAVIAIAGFALAVVPETAPGRKTASASSPAHRRRLLAVPSGRAREFFASGGLGLTAFATFGTFTSLVPVILVDSLGESNRILSGALVMLVMGTAAGSQLLMRGAQVPTLAISGAVLYPLGWILTTVAVVTSSIAVFVAAAIVGGTAAGMLFKSGTATVDRIADPDRRAGAHAGFFLIAYIGMALPVIGLAALSGVTGTAWAVGIFGGGLTLLMAASAVTALSSSVVPRRKAT